MSEPDCVFCKIAAGLVPSVRVYEDADTLAFMDVAPIIKGHTLVIPREHYDPITQTPPDVLAKLIAVVQRVVRAQLAGLEAEGVNVTQANGRAAGQVVPHLHFHVIPRRADDGHHWNWRTVHYTSDAEMKQTAARLAAAL